MSMNIWTLGGKKIIFQPDLIVDGQTWKNGSDFDRNYASKFLEVGKEYVVKKTNVGNFHTNVILMEFPKQVFNSVLFINSDIQTEQEDKYHPDWDLYNEE